MIVKFGFHDSYERKKPPRLIGGFSRTWNYSAILGYRGFILQPCKDATIRAAWKPF
jgi:hypothetical protein